MIHTRANKLSLWYDAYLEKILPRYAFFSLMACFILNCTIYWLTMYLGQGAVHYDLTLPLDKAVPFRPAWVSVYVLSYPFWIVSYWITAAKSSKCFWFRFVTADLTAKIVCGIIFLLFPTTNVRPEIAGDGLWQQLMALVYSADQPVNLFPSLHCLMSLFSYLGVRKAEGTPGAYKVGTLIFAVLIFLSTQFTKQHYIVDIFGAVAVAFLCYVAAMKTDAYLRVTTFFERLDKIIFSEEGSWR